MRVSGRERQLLAEHRRERRDEEDEEAVVRPRRDPAKLTTADAADAPPGLLTGLPPGKLTREHLPGGALSPGGVLRYADAISHAPRPQIDRRAELGAGELDEDGALAGAFS